MNTFEDETTTKFDTIDTKDEFIDRPTSAPPQLGVINGNIYGLDGTKISHDFRMHPSYEKYYESKVSQDPSLPPPISYLTNWLGDTHISNNGNYDLFNSEQMNNTVYHHNFQDTSFPVQQNNIPSSYMQHNSNGVHHEYDERSSYFYSSQPQIYHHHSFNNQNLSINPNQMQPLNGIQPFKPSKMSTPPKNSPKNKNLGKVVINSDLNLSSSTEDLLSLAGQTHLKANNQINNSSINELPIVSLNTSSKNGSNKMKPINTNLYQDESYNMVNDYDTNQTPKTTSEKVTLCRYFLQGHCNKGDKCMYSHGNETSLLPEETSPRKNDRNLATPTKYTGLKIEDCIGRIYSMSKDQHGCRFLQKKLDEDRTHNTCQIIFNEIHENMTELMSGPFGNYLCQKLIEKCSKEQRIAILEKISDNLVLISRNIHGTRAVQKAIESINSREEIKLVRKALKGSVVPLIQDLNGNHVIQKCINTMEPNDKQFIYDAVAQHCVQVATHKHGCCVMQRCIDHASHNQRLQLIEEIKDHSLELVQDAFGNYVVQYSLDLGFEEICEKIAEKLLGHIGYLSTQKFSSNVVEKCLKVGNSRTVQMISKELSELSDDDPSFKHSPDDPLIQLLQHPFGNYVVQTALQISAIKAVNEWHLLADRIRPHLQSIKSSHYLKKIHSLLSQGPKQ